MIHDQETRQHTSSLQLRCKSVQSGFQSTLRLQGPDDKQHPLRPCIPFSPLKENVPVLHNEFSIFSRCQSTRKKIRILIEKKNSIPTKQQFHMATTIVFHKNCHVSPSHIASRNMIFFYKSIITGICLFTVKTGIMHSSSIFVSFCDLSTEKNGIPNSLYLSTVRR